MNLLTKNQEAFMYTDEEKRENDRLRKAFRVLDTLITRAELLDVCEENTRKQLEDKE